MNWLENLARSFLDWARCRSPADHDHGRAEKHVDPAAASTVLGIVIGMVLAIMGISRSPWLRIPARIYTDIFRGLPAIVTILLIGQGFARIGRELFGPSPYPLGVLALSLIAGAYIGEIFRSGIQSVERGQMEACRALSMSYGQGMRLIVVPQGVRRVLPALVNQFIGNVKDSSLVYFLGLLASRTARIFRVGQDQAVVTAISRRSFSRASSISSSRCRSRISSTPSTAVSGLASSNRRAITSGLEEVSELDRADHASQIAFKGGSFGSPRSRHGLWRARRAEGRRPLGEVRQRHLHHRPFRFGQVDGFCACLNRLVEPKCGDTCSTATAFSQMKPERLRRRVGMVFQHFNLFPDHTALENVMLSLTKIKGLPRAEAERIAKVRLADVGLAAASIIAPGSSGGQQQRVAIARALAMEPEVIPISTGDECAGPRAR